MAIFRRELAPRERPQVVEHRGIAASAARLPLDNRKAMKKVASKRMEWQDESWDYFDDVPEIKGVTWLGGNVMSKLRLFVGVRPPGEPDAEPIPGNDPDANLPSSVYARAQAELDRIKSPLGGRPEIIRAFSMNLEIAGELYLHCRGPRDVTDEATGETYTEEEAWNVRSVDEVEVGNDGTVKIHQRPGDNGEPLDPTRDSITRIWQRHPRWSYLPDNNMRGVLSECEAVVLLSNQVKAIAKSATSAGFFTLPNELGYNVAPVADDDDSDAEEDEFFRNMNEQLTAPIEDPSSAASVQPMLIRGQAEFLKPDVLRHIPMTRDTDATLDSRIEARIERIARGLNYPVEAVKGSMNTTFANAAQIDEDKFRDHYEPKCVLLCDSLTVGVIAPALYEAHVAPDVVDRVCVWYDASSMLKSVDPLESADYGFTEGTVSEEAWRRVKGWTEDDAPSPVERLVRAVMHLRSFDPGVSTAILELIGVPLDVQAPVEQPAPAIPLPAGGEAKMSMEVALLTLLRAKSKGEPVSESVARLIEPALAQGGLKAALHAHNNPGRLLMELDRDLRAKLQVAADRALTRALERAGNRIKSGGNTQLRQIVRTVAPIYAAANAGPKLVASGGFSDDELIGAEAWLGLQQQFFDWVGAAQARALVIVGRVVSIHRADLAARQARDAQDAWAWFSDELHALAVERLYQPDPSEPIRGEHDSSRVPVGLIRQAIARAGGATSIEPVTPRTLAAAKSDVKKSVAVFVTKDTYAATNNDAPMGGIGTGELISVALVDGGASVEAYEWVYGPAFRVHPFEEHEALDGEVFDDFESDVLAAGDWVGDFYFPGDHDGCNCDFVPVVVAPEELEQ